MILTNILFVVACALVLAAPYVPAIVRWVRGKLAPAPKTESAPVVTATEMTIVVSGWEDDEDEEDDDEPDEVAPPRRVYTGTNAFPRTISYFSDTTATSQEPPKPAAAAMEPGRQTLKGLTDQDPYGRRKAWSRPFPSDAHSAAWADIHEYAPGVDKQRDPRAAFIGQEPPIAMVCPGCELEQPPLRSDDVRPCPYCGLRLKLFGARVFWWREAVDVQEWQP